MARLPRLAIAGLPHYVIQRGHNGGPVVVDDVDRQAFLDVLHDAARAHGVAVHAYALADTEFHLLATPESGRGLSLAMQALGRRHAARFNRRHGRSGSLWDGRFRAAVIEPGAAMTAVLQLVDRDAALVDPVHETDPLRTSAGHRLGRQRLALVTDPVEYWQLGNTPFEREARWAERLAHPLPAPQQAQIRHAALQGWVYGGRDFVERLAAESQRPLRPRRRGRPPRNG